MGKKRLDEPAPDTDAEPPCLGRFGSLFAKLGGLFRRRKAASDAFGQDPEPAAPEDPFGVGDAEQDARFRRQRRLMAVALVLLLLGGGGGAGAYIWLADHSPKPQAAALPAEGGSRILQPMPLEPGPENLFKALMQPPVIDNPDALRRMGALAPGGAPAPSGAPAPQAAKPAPASVAMIDEPATPTKRVDRDQASRPPKHADLPKSTPGTAAALPKAPLSDLQQRTPAGFVLPTAAENGRQAWRTYGRSFAGKPRTPRVAVILRGLGLAAGATTAATDLMPPDVTLAFDVGTVQLLERLAAVRKSGHETLLEIGMESSAFPAVDPGPDGLLTALLVEENDLRLARTLAHGDVYVGVLSSGGDRYATSAPHFGALMRALKKMGLAYVTSSRAAPFETVQTLPAHALIDIQIDESSFREQITARLKQAEATAKARGAVLIVANASPLTLSLISSWISGLDLQLAPISAVVKE